MQDLKDLKRCFSRERSRGTGPRATVDEAASRLTRFGIRRSRTTVSGHVNARGGQAPALRTHLANPVNRVNPAPILLNLENLVNPAQNPAHNF